MIKIPDFSGIALLIDDGDGGIVDDTAKSIDNREICFADLIEPPPIKLSFGVYGK